MDRQAIVSVKNAALNLGGRTLWRGMNLDISAGECIAVLGPNGAGKSSFINMLLGLHQPGTGTVSIFGQQAHQARKNIGYVPQQKAFDRELPISGRQLVTLGVHGATWFMAPLSKAQKEQVETAIKEVGALAYADKPLGTLSGGEQQRLRIAQALASSPQLLLCDEPLLSLDIASQHQVAAILQKRRKKGTAIVFVTHEINPVLPFVDRILYIVDGKWTIGSPKDVLTSSHLTALYGAPVEVLNVHGQIIVISTGEQTSTEPHDPHHHLQESEHL